MATRWNHSPTPAWASKGVLVGSFLLAMCCGACPSPVVVVHYGPDGRESSREAFAGVGLINPASGPAGGSFQYVVTRAAGSDVETYEVRTPEMVLNDGHGLLFGFDGQTLPVQTLDGGTEVVVMPAVLRVQDDAAAERFLTQATAAGVCLGVGLYLWRLSCYARNSRHF